MRRCEPDGEVPSMRSGGSESTHMLPQMRGKALFSRGKICVRGQGHHWGMSDRARAEASR